jgi:alpha-D-ribose 1-methylphosphonate 5-triphosphate synthase subunit PhnH
VTRAGLRDPVLDAQRAFRALLDAIAHPGRVVALPPVDAPPPLDTAAMAICLTLVDHETPLWLDDRAATPEVLEHLRLHCGCPIVEDPSACRFALVADAAAVPPITVLEAGTDESPEGSATLIVQVPALAGGRGRRLSGPGIAREAFLDAQGPGEEFWAGLRDNHARFPRGVDVLLTAGATAAALPRTTRVEG